jgi:oligopeptide transport system substrate-binding protein
MTFKKLVSLFLVIGMLFSVVACTGSNTPEEPTGPTETTYKTTFTYSVGGEPTYIDPAKCGDSVTAEIQNEVWLTLFYLGEDGSSVPSGCESYTVSDDNLTYTFKLREDTAWSDGVPVTADQYVYGIKRCLTLGSGEVGYLNMISDYILNAEKYDGVPVAEQTDLGVKAVDDYTLEITLKSVCPYFVSMLPTQVFCPLREDIAPENDYTWSGTVGYPTSGAFVPTKIDSASEYVMVKNPNWYGAKDVVVETMTAKIMPSMEASQTAFLTGEIDYDTSAGSEAMQVAELQDCIHICGSINYYMNFNMYDGAEALQDVRVRRAIQLGIDRQSFVTAFDSGDLYYELNGFIPVGLPGANGDFRTEADADHKLVYTDKEAARALMEEAGFSETNRLKLGYYYNQNSMHDTAAAIIASELKDIYIDVELKTAELRTFFDDRSYGRYDMARNAFSADYMDPWNFLELMAIYNDSEKYGTHYGDETFDEKLLATMEMTGEERMAALHDAEAYAIEEACFNCPLFGYGTVSLQRPGTTGVMTNPQANHIFWFVKCPE